MSERLRGSSITRRGAVKGAVALATLSVSSALAGQDAGPAVASPASRAKRERVAIIGAGAGGVAARICSAASTTSTCSKRDRRSAATAIRT
jgi:hypothetical protein